MKRRTSVRELCASHASHFIPFAKLVYALEFTEEPDYGKLKHALVIGLLKRD